MAALAGNSAAIAADIAAPGEPANYISLFGGWTDGFGHSHIDNDVIEFSTNGGFLFGGAVGTHFAPNWRVESELSFISNRFDDGREEGGDPRTDITGRVRSVLFTTNVWRDFNFGVFNPYVGGGLGSGFVNARGDADTVSGSASWDDTSLAITGQLGAGVRVPLTDRVQADLGYRFRAVYAAGMDGSDRFGGAPDENGNFAQYIHSVQLGVSYAFGPQTIPAAAAGDGDWYASIFGGFVMPEASAVNYSDAQTLRHKNGFSVGAAVGTRITPRLRAEAELSYLTKKAKSFSEDGYDFDPASGSLRQTYILANVWHDMPMGMFSPYIGGGLGFGFINGDRVDRDGDTLGDKTGVGLATQLGAGVRAQFGDSLAFDVGYRMKSIIEANVGAANGNDELSAVSTVDHILQAGLTYGFGSSPVIQDDSQLGDWYVSVFGGGVFPANNHISASYSSDYFVRHKNGFTVGAAIGREVADNVRAELEISHVRYKVKDSQDQSNVFDPETGDLAFTYVMANLWHDWDMGAFKPYAGFGVGVAFSSLDYTLDNGDVSFDDSGLNAAAQLGSGVRFDVTDNLTLDVGYRLKATASVVARTDTPGDGIGFGHHMQHVVQAGASWSF